MEVVSVVYVLHLIRLRNQEQSNDVYGELVFVYYTGLIDILLGNF